MYDYNETEQRIANRLIKLGLHISSKGFNYILTGMILIHDNDEVGICQVYEQIAKKYNTTRARVERCIREDVMEYYNTVSNIPSLLTCDYYSGKLTNKEFIYRLSYMFRDILRSSTDKS